MPIILTNRRKADSIAAFEAERSGTGAAFTATDSSKWTAIRLLASIFNILAQVGGRLSFAYFWISMGLTSTVPHRRMATPLVVEESLQEFHLSIKDDCVCSILRNSSSPAGVVPS